MHFSTVASQLGERWPKTTVIQSSLHTVCSDVQCTVQPKVLTLYCTAKSAYTVLWCLQCVQRMTSGASVVCLPVRLTRQHAGTLLVLDTNCCAGAGCCALFSTQNTCRPTLHRTTSTQWALVLSELKPSKYCQRKFCQPTIIDCFGSFKDTKNFVLCHHHFNFFSFCMGNFCRIKLSQATLNEEKVALALFIHVVCCQTDICFSSWCSKLTNSAVNATLHSTTGWLFCPLKFLKSLHTC